MTNFFNYLYITLATLYLLFCLTLEFVTALYFKSLKKIRPEFFSASKLSTSNLWIISLAFPMLSIWPGGVWSHFAVFCCTKTYRSVMDALLVRFYPKNCNVGWWTRFVKNPVDAPFFGLLLLFVTHNALFIWISSGSIGNALIIFPFYIIYQETFGLAMEWLFHWNMHLDPFKHNIFSLVLQIAAILFGYIPRVYRTNHLLIHHKENNNASDFQSTAKYNRSSILEFGIYSFGMWLDYTTCIGVYRYLSRRIQKSRVRIALAEMFLGQLTFVLIILVLWKLQSPILILIAFTYAPAGFYISKGAWLWHSLIDPTNPNTVDTSTTNWNGYVAPFNDNIHAGHHRAPRLHWSQLRDVTTAAPTVHINIMDHFLRYCFTKQFQQIADHSSLATADKVNEWLSPVPNSETETLRVLRHWSIKDSAENALMYMYKKCYE